MEAETAIDRRPLIEGLRRAAEANWSGLLRVERADEQTGAIVLREGRIAWTVYKEQQEDLGTFLYRLGKLTREQLNEVQERYLAMGKTKKLGALLEESGMLSRPVLRQCLLLHMRSALFKMISDGGLTVIARGGDFKVEEDLTFSVDEVFSPRENDDDIDARDHIFAELAQIPGYRSTIVAGEDGTPLLIHGAGDDARQSLHCAKLPVKWLHSAREVGWESGLGNVGFAYFEYEDCSIVVRWLGEHCEFLAAVCMERVGKLGMVKHKLTMLASALEAYIMNLKYSRNASQGETS
jgi:hypothetical protein